MTEPTTTKRPNFLEATKARISSDLAAVIEGKVPVDIFIDAVMLQIKTSYMNGKKVGKVRKDEA